jgi:hypothetical protein
MVGSLTQRETASIDRRRSKVEARYRLAAI